MIHAAPSAYGPIENEIVTRIMIADEGIQAEHDDSRR